MGSVGNMSVEAPTSAASGSSGTVTVDYNGLEEGRKYLGVVMHDGNEPLPSTIINISTE